MQHRPVKANFEEPVALARELRYSHQAAFKIGLNLPKPPRSPRRAEAGRARLPNARPEGPAIQRFASLG